MKKKKMNKHDPQNPPLPGRLIRCIGEDSTWDFDSKGKFESPDQGLRPVFFSQRQDGTFFADRFKWNHTKVWEYVDAE